MIDSVRKVNPSLFQAIRKTGFGSSMNLSPIADPAIPVLSVSMEKFLDWESRHSSDRFQWSVSHRFPCRGRRRI